MMRRHSEMRLAAAVLFGAWFVHDAEEAFTLPATSRMLADRYGRPGVEVTSGQGVLAIGLVGVLVGGACIRGSLTSGKSRLFRAVLAGLEAHVVTHVLSAVVVKRYTAGLITAPLVMLPGARIARAAVRRTGSPLAASDTVRGALLMFGAALASHVIARAAIPARRHV